MSHAALGSGAIGCACALVALDHIRIRSPRSIFVSIRSRSPRNNLNHDCILPGLHYGLNSMRSALSFLFGLLMTASAAEEVPLTGRIDAAITRGVDFLVADQNANGSWGSATRTKGLNIYAPLPGAHHAFRAGASGLALAGMIDSGDQRPEVKESIRKAGEWATENLPKLRRADPTTTYNIWGHAYGLRALTRLYGHETDAAAKDHWKQLARQQIELVDRYADVNGGWGYLDIYDEVRTQKPSGIPTSFSTATVLLAMDEAKRTMGLPLDPKVVDAAIKSIHIQQSPDFTYTYSFNHRMSPRGDINRPAGSLSRSQVCNAALRRFGDEAITDKVITEWAERFIAREGFLRNTRKRPVPHEGPFKLAGYFYYYGCYYFTESVKLLPADQQAKHARAIAETILPLQETDGSWWDYPLYDYHQPYGTGYALMTLAWCREVLKDQAP